MSCQNLETVRRLDFARLAALVAERITALQYVAAGLRDDTPANDAICRDLILPNVYLLAQFVEAVRVEEGK